jgi:glycosyltransferase A (GT-A) superfamily protein (DUF2064 family)
MAANKAADRSPANPGQGRFRLAAAIAGEAAVKITASILAQAATKPRMGSFALVPKN